MTATTRVDPAIASNSAATIHGPAARHRQWPALLLGAFCLASMTSGCGREDNRMNEKITDNRATEDDNHGDDPAILAAGPGGEKTPASGTAKRPTFSKPSEVELRKRLSPMQYEVTQNDATERAFSNPYWDSHDDGLYVDIVSGEPLFASRDKFDSGTGWPSFTRPIEAGRVVEKVDSKYGMQRREARSVAGKSHLGHVFDDGPRPTRQRYCINSASLRFVPVAKLEAEGYGAWRAAVTGVAADVQVTTAGKASAAADGDKDPTDNACAVPKKGEPVGCETSFEEIVLAGGCFWGVEELLRGIPGVIETEVGYAGGATAKPTYDEVKRGTTGHAESVRIVFDPKKLSLQVLLRDWFFRIHDPTTKNRQGNDVGSQYRSAIFLTDEKQRDVAEAAVQAASKSGRWSKPIVTEIVKSKGFTAAEGYHQDYLQLHPNGYTCHFMRD
jgi:peptide methionine sulfoxide reductase msrA/msrB